MCGVAIIVQVVVKITAFPTIEETPVAQPGPGWRNKKVRIELVVAVSLASLALSVGERAQAQWQKGQYRQDDGSVVKQTVTLRGGTLRLEHDMPDGRVLRSVMLMSRTAAVIPPLKASTETGNWGVEVQCDAAKTTPPVNLHKNALVQPNSFWGNQQIGDIVQSIKPIQDTITIRQSRSEDPPGMGQEYWVPRRSIVRDETEINFEDGKWVLTLHSKRPDIVLKITRSDGSTITEHVDTADVFFSTEAEARDHANAIASLQ